MGILLSFAPFILFVIIERLEGVKTGLLVAAFVSAALPARNFIGPRKTAKVLEIGTAILFAVLAAYACFSNFTWPLAGVRLCVAAGLLLVVLVSMAVRQPFTLQYAREQVAPKLWDRPEFVRVNYIITAVWASAFALMVASDLVLLYAPKVPSFVGIVATFVAMIGAIRFTSWYPSHGHHK